MGGWKERKNGLKIRGLGECEKLFCCLGCGNYCVFVILCVLDAGNAWNGKGGLYLFVFLFSINDKGCY